MCTFYEEPRAAYNRVKLTPYFETLNPDDLSMTSEFDKDGKTAWYEENGAETHMGDEAVELDREKKMFVKIVSFCAMNQTPCEIACFAISQ